MKRIKLLVFMMLGMSCLFQSCKSDLDQLHQENSVSADSKAFENERKQRFAANAVDESIKGDFELEDGILHFKNVASFIKLRDSFVNLKMAERAEFAEKNGFESRLSITFKALEKIRNAKSKAEYEKLIASTIDYVAYDEKTQLAVSRISDDCSASILTKDGLVYIGKILYKFSNGKEYIVFDGDKSKLESVKSGRVGESLEISVISTTNTSQANKSARICTYAGVIGWSTNPQYQDRSGKVEYKVDGLEYFYEPNSNYDNPWRVNGHSYVKGSAMCPSYWGGRTDYWTWNHLFVNFKLQLVRSGYGTILGTERVRDSKLEAGYGTDFHSYVSGYSPTNSSVDIVLNDNNPVIIPESPGENKFNWAEAGPNQWLYPNDCHWYPIQW